MAAGDLTSTAAVKAQLETSATAADAVIDTLVTAASRAIRVWTSREFAGPVAAETRRFAVDGYAGSRFGVPVGDLRQTPTAVTVTDRSGATTATLTPGSDLEYLPLIRDSATEPITAVRLLNATSVGLDSRSILVVTGLWGWPAVPADVAQAAIIAVRSWLRQDSNRWANMIETEDGRVISPTPEGGFMLPTSSRQLLANYRLRGIV